MVRGREVKFRQIVYIDRLLKISKLTLDKGENTPDLEEGRQFYSDIGDEKTSTKEFKYHISWSNTAPWGSGFPRPGDLGTQLDTVGVPPWNIHVFSFIPGGGRVAGLIAKIKQDVMGESCRPCPRLTLMPPLWNIMNLRSFLLENSCKDDLLIVCLSLIKSP